MDTKTQAIINELAFQRNKALDTIASLSGEIAVLNDVIKKLEEELSDLKKVKPDAVTRRRVVKA